MRDDVGIEVDGLSRRYGTNQALDAMNFTVQPGRVTGFIGPNGAGKSTTMRVVLGLVAPDAGRALVGGRPYRSLAEPLRVLGSLLDAGALQPSRTAHDHLLWIAHTQGLQAKRVDEVLAAVGLTSAARRRAGDFSLGMRQRLGIAAALLGDPRALMLDEPFNGLDPEGIQWIRGLLRSLADQGRTVLVSSHLMSELEGAADHVIVIGRGRVLVDASVHELLAGVAAGRVTLRTAAPQAAADALGRAGATVQPAGPDTLTVSGMAGPEIVATLNAASVAFTELGTQRVTLEQAYLGLTQDTVQYRGTAPTDTAAEAES
ncbi:ABC transporter ATP-binding protein [Jiangella alkaliphila]|uniref:ABC-2 type transport system ATP-binding protein n=1 Tax=Jiangella alkaliphila TaxID=419479 RepID=A0A1H2KBP4_9ACTN|nr:ATP-binding cassette domain-containing protein [Jiangella alkaliphila]SDU65848.1 ABC-2 type transport system ATP-binding protein [Jiangella alkaliphila]